MRKTQWEKLSPLTGWVIVVEDDPSLRMLIGEVLTELGLHSLEFSTADEATRYMSGSHGGCPLLIADYGLPGQIQGAEFIEMMKLKWPSTAAILTSGYDLNSSMVPAGTTYLHKPWSIDDLILAVTTLLKPGSPLAGR
jgi:DNA-binding response OmpR family regulator